MLKSKDRNRTLILSRISVAKCVNVYYRSLYQEHINNTDTYELVCSVVCTVVIVVSVCRSGPTPGDIWKHKVRERGTNHKTCFVTQNAGPGWS